MKGRLSIFGIVLLLSMVVIVGCDTTGGIDIEAPDVKVDVDGPDVKVNMEASEVIRGSGNVVAADRPVNDFNRISLTGAGDVIITQGDEESLTVETDENLMRYIKTEVKNGTLVLGFTDEVRNKRVRPTRGIKFNLKVREVAGLELSGAGDIDASSLKVDGLEIRLNGAGDVSVGSLEAEKLVVRIDGAGDVELAGQVMEQDIRINGAGVYRAAELESQGATVTVSGAGDATVWATDTLDVRIPGVGNVYYHGNPRVTKKLSGVGRLTAALAR
jgi:hypothetical protein